MLSPRSFADRSISIREPEGPRARNGVEGLCQKTAGSDAGPSSASLPADHRNRPVQHLVAPLTKTGYCGRHRNVRFHAGEVVRRLPVVTGHPHAGEEDAEATGHGERHHVPVGARGGAPDNRGELGDLRSRRRRQAPRGAPRASSHARRRRPPGSRTARSAPAPSIPIRDRGRREHRFEAGCRRARSLGARPAREWTPGPSAGTDGPRGRGRSGA